MTKAIRGSMEQQARSTSHLHLLNSLGTSVTGSIVGPKPYFDWLESEQQEQGSNLEASPLFDDWAKASQSLFFTVLYREDKLVRELEAFGMNKPENQEDEKLDEGIPVDLSEFLATMPQMDDSALWQAARNTLAREADEKLRQLNTKRQRRKLTNAEEHLRSELLHQYDRGVLIRSRAAVLLKQRGYDVNVLLVQP